MSIKISQKDIKDLQKDINDAIEDSMKDTYKFYRKETPVRSGNARNKTKYRETSRSYNIESKYDYAGPLDAGRSKQAPNGFTKPSFDFLKDKITKSFKKI